MRPAFGGRPVGDAPAPARWDARSTEESVRAAGAIRSTGGAELDAARAVLLQGAAASLVTRMEQSLAVPTATSFRDVPVAVLEGARTRLNAAISPRRLSYTHLIGFAVAQAATVHSAMSASFKEIDGRPHRLEPRQPGLGIAVDVERADGGRFLVVPVIHRVEDLDFGEFLAAYDDLVRRARAGRLRPDDLAGATITLSNPGTVGTTASVPRLMAGQGTIVATGAIRRTGDGPMMTVSSTYDHRVIQGAESGRFLQTLDELLQGADSFYEEIAASLGLGALALERPAAPSAPPTSSLAEARSPAGEAGLAEVAVAVGLVGAYRQFGHRVARLDPLGREPPGDPSLDPATWGLAPGALARLPASALGVDVPGDTLSDVLAALRRTYCDTSAFEVEHIGRHEERAWLRRAIESGDYRAGVAAETKRRLLERLTAVEALERFLQRAFLGQKRFSIEGLDVLVPMLDQLIELVAASGTQTVEIGMAHRGRLNVLAHVVGVPYAAILADFERSGPTAEAEPALDGETSDVKYHRGADGVYQSAHGPVRVTVSSNPSHLEAIDPIVEGRARAEQTDRTGARPERDTTVAVPLLIHGDAAFAGQGVVAETFNLARLEGYTTGGTIHLIANNQLGFTVEPSAGRSTDYASDLAKGFDVPIVHVNADDPEACLGAIRLAVAYREQFHGDFVIDLVGYRRHGHNEEDEPAYTQPNMYALVADHPTVRELYLRRLAAEGVVEEGPAEEQLRAAEERLEGIRESLRSADRAATDGERAARVAGPVSGAAGAPQKASGATAAVGRSRESRSPGTGVPADRLREIEADLLRTPSGFTVHPKLVPQLERRREALEGGRVAWAQAEALALGSLVLDGRPVRLTGQDTRRGTFSQRHLVLYDATSGRSYAPIRHLPGATASFELHDSPLSEYACLGFEYGYAVEAPEALVIWEAQYGDFANEAEVIIDQFLIAGLAKWGQTSRLTLLLPHGYEGQGPEHSSARLERFLALGAEGNIRVANCTTPAQYFHLLRNQALRATPRPLVLLTPKSLLRLPAATSRLEELAERRFLAVLDDPEPSIDPAAVRRLVLCSGRIFFDLSLSPRRAAAPTVAIARAELLYPFPGREVRDLVAHYPHLEVVVWAQEEPRNMGARKFVLPKLQEIVPAGVQIVDVSRPERSAPAEGYSAAHRAEQARIVEETLGA